MKNKIKLNIAGEAFNVLFDGEKVTSPEFPDQPINYTASCGMKITQEMLVQICKTKVAKAWTDSVIDSEHPVEV
jgi:hypothetical protein